MHKFIPLLALILVISCSTPTYYYYFHDSGFAQINKSTLEYTYTLQNASTEMVTPDNIEQYVSDLNFSKTTRIIGHVDCNYHEQWGVRSLVVCYDKRKPVIFHEIKTKGNHQFIETFWKDTNYRYDIDVCNVRDGALCVLKAHVPID